MFFIDVFKCFFYKSLKGMLLCFFYLQINVFNIYAVDDDDIDAVDDCNE